MKHNKFNINFNPMIEQLSQKDLEQISYASSYKIFNFLPQGLLKLIKKCQWILFLSAFLYIILTVIFHIKLFLDFEPVLFSVLIFLGIAASTLNVKSNISDLREENFKSANSKNIFWKINSLNSEEYDMFDIASVLNILTNHDLYAEAYNILGFIDSKISTGDIIYYQNNNYDNDTITEKIICPYVAKVMQTNLAGMRLNRKKFGYTNLFRKKAFDLPEGVADSLFVNYVHQADKELIINTLQKNNLGKKIEQIFNDYPQIVNVNILNDLVIISLGDNITDSFDTPKQLSEKVIEKYEMRLSAINDLVKVIENK